ncbi:shikimate kinase [Leuconostocaceae bacterium ESL0958]|nr:shikimate kinase [Leuconostocaceae bacterium ESL0958]
MTLILIGFMGAGKSTVGQALGQALKQDYVDLDEFVAAKAAMSIPDYFNRYGEAAFRQLEQAALSEALQQADILSTGGGTPLYAGNQALLRAQPGAVIFLDASDATIEARLLADGVASRPLFQELGLAGLLDLKAARQSSYEALADQHILVDGQHPAAIADCILTNLANS